LTRKGSGQNRGNTIEVSAYNGELLISEGNTDGFPRKDNAVGSLRVERAAALSNAANWETTAKKVRSKGHFFYPWKDKDRYGSK
jgi:hypothetical protein